MKKIKDIVTAKRLAIAMALIALVSFGYKLTIGILATSLVLIIAAFPTLFVFICKALYAKNMEQSQADKKKTYFVMTIVTACYAVIFILFSVLKVGGIDITNKNRFEGWIGIIFILFIIVMFVLSIINLRGALNKDDLVVIGIKEISFVAALADAVMINAFLYRVLLKYLNLPFMSLLNNTFPLAVGVLMAVVPIFMFKRWREYNVN